MFKKRNTVASQLLRMFKKEKRRSHLLAAHLIEGEAHEEESSGDLMQIVMAVGPILAAIASIFAFTESKTKDKDKDGKDDKQTTPEEGSSTPRPVTSDVSGEHVKTAKSDVATRAAIKNAASMKQVDYKLLYAVAGAESSFRSGVGASTSSAVGLFQFTESTWNELCQTYKLRYSPEDRKDPQKSAEVAGLYIKSIDATLQRALGRKPSYGEVYMGYFLGPAGASRFLKAMQQNPNAVGAEMFPKAANANPGVFYERGDRSKPLTLRQILSKQEGKIVSYAEDAEPNQAGTANPQGVEVALRTPEQQPSTVSSSAPGSNASQASTRIGNSGKTVVAVQQAIPQVSASSEQAPSVNREKPDKQQQQAPSVVATNDAPAPANTTIIRGRDRRMYVVNT